MSEGSKDQPKPSDNVRSSLGPEEARHWLAHFREARARALADAEGFDAILFALEGFGQFLYGEVGRGLSDYEPGLKRIAFGQEPSGGQGERFDKLFSMVRRVRNDAMHQGAIARNATVLCVELVLMLEGGLLANATTLGDYMITSPVEAKLFEAVGAVRRTMLMNSFSFLPVRTTSGQWMLASDLALAKHLQGLSNGERNRRLAQSLQDSSVELLDATLMPPDTPIGEIIEILDSRPILVLRDIQGTKELVGLVTAFDLI